MIILDTDVLTIIQRGSSQAYSSLIARLPSNGSVDTVCVTIISFEEQMRGWLAYIAKAKASPVQVQGYGKLRALFEDFQNRPVLDYDSNAAAQYERLVAMRVRTGTMDLKIASIALSHDALLVSRNLADFRKVPGLRVEDWTR